MNQSHLLETTEALLETWLEELDQFIVAAPEPDASRARALKAPLLQMIVRVRVRAASGPPLGDSHSAVLEHLLDMFVEASPPASRERFERLKADRAQWLQMSAEAQALPSVPVEQAYDEDRRAAFEEERRATAHLAQQIADREPSRSAAEDPEPVKPAGRRSRSPGTGGQVSSSSSLPSKPANAPRGRRTSG